MSFLTILSVAILLLLILLIVAFSIYYLIVPVIKGAPYVPTRPEAVRAMLKLSSSSPGQRMVDLGSGNGRILIAFAREGLEAHGYEINPILVWRSRFNIKRAGLKNKAFVHLGSFWPVDMSPFDYVVIYGLNHIMKPLEKKLQKELRSGAKVLSNAFKFPFWKEKEKIGGVSLYVKK
jgi:SAM-dependent methyltransferase